MALYLGNNEMKNIIFGGTMCRLSSDPIVPILNGEQLISSDDLVLKDSNNWYITLEDGE